MGASGSLRRICTHDTRAGLGEAQERKVSKKGVCMMIKQTISSGPRCTHTHTTHRITTDKKQGNSEASQRPMIDRLSIAAQLRLGILFPIKSCIIHACPHWESPSHISSLGPLLRMHNLVATTGCRQGHDVDSAQTARRGNPT